MFKVNKASYQQQGVNSLKEWKNQYMTLILNGIAATERIALIKKYDLRRQFLGKKYLALVQLCELCKGNGS